MIWLLLTAALAQEPQTFTEFPADVEQDGEVYKGILVDEETYSELIELRVAVATKDAEIESFERWQASHTALMKTSLLEVRTTCEEGQQRLVDHYEGALEHERKKDWLQRHAFPVGVAVGLVGATAVYLGAVHLYGEVLTVNL